MGPSEQADWIYRPTRELRFNGKNLSRKSGEQLGRHLTPALDFHRNGHTCTTMSKHMWPIHVSMHTHVHSQPTHMGSSAKFLT